MITDKQKEDFIIGYKKAILFTESSYEDENDENGTPLDENFTIRDFSKKAEALIESDCNEMIEYEKKLFCYLFKLTSKKKTYTPEQAGIDFWFTRNGHGTGYWDKLSDHYYKKQCVGDTITETVKENFETQNIYISQKGEIEFDNDLFYKNTKKIMLMINGMNF